MIYTDKYPHLKYIEVDLPDMIATKKALISKIWLNKNDRLSLKIANSLNTEELDKAVSSLDKGPVLIFNVGLINYFSLKEKEIFCRNIHSILSRHGGIWITPDPALHRESRKEMFKDTITKDRLDNKIAKTTGRNYDDNAFADEAETDAFFLMQGFTVEKYMPHHGYDLISSKNAGLTDDDAKAMLKYANTYSKVWILSEKK
jgi:O-methyltransferase involved in polyketide biosynthesis